MLCGNILVASVRNPIWTQISKKGECNGLCTCEVEGGFQWAPGTATSRSSNSLSLHPSLLLVFILIQLPSTEAQAWQDDPRLACSDFSQSTLASLTWILWSSLDQSLGQVTWGILINQIWVMRTLLGHKTTPVARAGVKPHELCFPRGKESSTPKWRRKKCWTDKSNTAFIYFW